MSYGSIYTCTHKVDTSGTTTTYTIDILKKGYSGFPQEVKGWEETFLLEYDRINVREPFKTPINQGRMEFYVAIRSSDELDLLNEVFSGEEDTHQLRLKKDGTIIWTGFVLKDLLQYSNGDYPYRATIMAKDTTRLNQFTFPLSEGRQKLIVTIADLLNDVGLGLDIYTYTGWQNDSFTTSDDFLNLTWHDLEALRDYGQDTGYSDDTTQTNYFWLDSLLRNFGLILRQADGAWRIYQISAIGNSVTQYRYNSSGVQQSTGSVDLRTTIDSSTKYLLPSSQNYYLPAIKKAQVNWNHRTKAQGIVIPDLFLITGQGRETYTQFFQSDGNQKINLRFGVTADFDGAVEPEGLTANFEVSIQSTGGNDYYLTENDTWTTSLTSRTVNLRPPRATGGVEYQAIGTVSIQSTNLPADADGELRISFDGAQQAIRTLYRSVEFEIINDTTKKNSESLSYQMTNTGNYSYTYDHGTVYFGDGPVVYAKSALKYADSNTALTNDNWKRTSDASYDSFFKLLLREFVDLQTYGLRILEADVYGVYNYSNILNYESALFFPLGGSLTGDNRWRLDFLNISYVDSGASLEELISGGIESIPAAGTQDVVDYWSTVKLSNFFNTVFLQNYVGELSAILEAGNRTSLTANLSAQLRAGEDFIVVDKENEKPYFINVTANVNTGENRTVAFDEQYFPVTLPVGSPIILSGGLLQSYFTIDPTKLKIQVDNVAGDFASLELRVDGTESSITQSVQFDNTGAYTKLIAGPGGSEFSIVADQINITGVINAINAEGVTTIDGDRITTGTITANEIDVTDLFSEQISIETGGYIQSVGYNGSNGFRINADGTAAFQEVTISSASSSIGGNAVLNSLTVNGRLTLNSGDLYATGSTGNYVILDSAGVRGVSNILGTVFNLPSDGSAPTFSSGVIEEVIFKIYTSGVIRTSDNALIGAGGDAGVLINNTGIFAGEAGQNTSTANFRVNKTGTIYVGNTAGTDYVKYESGTLTVRGTLNASDISAGTISSITVATGTATISGSTPSGTGTYLDSGGRMFSGSSGSGLFVDTPNGDIYIYDYTFNDTLGANSLYHRKDLGSNTSPNRAGFIHGIKYTDSGTPKWTGIAIGTGGSGDVYFAPHADDGTEFSYEFSKELIWSKANQRWEFDDDLYVGGTFTNPSDQRYKENIVPLGDVLDDVLSLSTVVYDMKDFMPDDERRMIGVYAQEIEQYFPEAVVTGTFIGDDGIEREIKSVSYTQLVPVLIKAIKELNDKIG